MKSVDKLVAEHDTILRGLDLLERVVAQVDAGQTPPREFVEWAPGFFAEFADGCHHAKEEDLFFPRLKERGIPEQGGPIGVMLHEHVIGRDCVRRMRESVAGDAFDGAQFSAAASEYIPLLRQHIFKENNILFRMAESVLSEDDDAEIAGQFSQVEEQQQLTALQERYEQQVQRWEAELA